MGHLQSMHNAAVENHQIDNETDQAVEMIEQIVEGNTKATLEEPQQPPQKEATAPTNLYKLVENAIKHKKVFAITGGYSTVRHSLRRRGWVEKFFNIPFSPKKTSVIMSQKYSGDISDVLCEDDGDYDDKIIDNDHPKIPPWEEDGGIYGEMSRMVHNVNPTLFWVMRRDTTDYNFLNKKQMVNHYGNVACFTTKAGLCTNLKNLMWFTDMDSDSFFPRCYLLGNEDERQAFIDDFRLTACMNIVKEAMKQHFKCMEPVLRASSMTEIRDQDHQGSNVDACSVASSDSIPRVTDGQLPSQLHNNSLPENEVPRTQKRKKKLKKKTKQQPVVPIPVLELAVVQCEKLLASKTHEDIDSPNNIGVLSEQEWDNLIKWSYQLVQEEGQFYNIPFCLIVQCESLMDRLSKNVPQFEMSGTHNVWIVKPGAKSRGRGIKCYEKLTDILALVSSLAARIEGKYVVQKYIEQPLLVYNTKFDIRQWFLVTDWNPLTVWFYKDSYLRFCSQQFTLEDFSESIHLSNNAIQKHYKNGPRSPRLPSDNMWASEQFKKYLEQNGHVAAWDKKIYPQMKQAVIGALLVSQNSVEYRKFSFELYGADFMLTEDLSPWLLEINASPSMESSTAITATMCKAVLEDTIKVVIDRKFNRNCDTGKFELAYKQPYVSTVSYTGISLCVIGHTIPKPNQKETCSQKKYSWSNGPVIPDCVGAQYTSNNTAADNPQQSSNFSMLGVRDILNNILFYNGNQIKSHTRSSMESGSQQHFLYTIPRSLRHANSVDPMPRKKCYKTTAEKTKNCKVSQTHKSSFRGKSSTTQSVQNGACQQCGRRNTFHLISTDPNCQCQKCSFVLRLPRNQLNTGAHNLSTSNCHHFNRNKIRYSKNKSPDERAQKAFQTTASCVTFFKENVAENCFETTPFETVGNRRTASAHCFRKYSSASPRPKCRYHNNKHEFSKLCYENPPEITSLSQKQQICNINCGSNCEASTAAHKNRSFHQKMLYRTLTSDICCRKRADG